jgi:RNA polymerase sigma factor for flagellar operon FliA
VLLKDALNSALDPDLVTPHSRPDGCASRRRDTYFRAVAERHASANALNTRQAVRYAALDSTA